MFSFNLFNHMKPTFVMMVLIPTLSLSFVLSYFMQITLQYWDQGTALAMIILLDGIFGIWSGIKREGFKTFKALKIFKSLFSWIAILFTVLVIEKAFPVCFWLSETFVVPVIVFYLISTLKNASACGLIKNELVKTILKRIDQHKNIEQ